MDIVKGGCRCRAVRYEITADKAPEIYCCHCLDCQCSSGSAFSQQGVLKDGTISATGPVIRSEVATRYGAISTQYWCERCGSRLWSTNSSRPGIAFLRAGTLDASDGIMPLAHIWTRRKQPWVIVPDGVATFEENAPPEAFAPLFLG